jgi:hypothetical protein
MAKELIKAEWANTRLGRQLERELRTGFQLEKEQERFRLMAAKQEAQEVRNGGNNMRDMKQVAAVPARDFWRLVQKYGHDEVHSKSFIRHLHKTNPSLKTANI